MAGLVNALVIVVVVALVLARQFRAAPVDGERRWWLVPGILAVMALRDPDLLDPGHRLFSGVLLAVEVLIGLVSGAGWAWTTRMWVEEDGVVWSRSTRASLGVWVGGVVLRVGLFGLGAALGVHLHSAALMLSLAAMLLVRAGFVTHRARTLAHIHAPSPSYGDLGSWKTRERV
ncbi:DUF1453 family protein [Streptomyces acidiscabies]|uniref:DUF1453 family protein n=1 Tax=Streptomyces acidiscabies TaxID=42234 RepID=UPI000952FD60|nr:DUF1453 family protein [Streptomyces acidiscabies]